MRVTLFSQVTGDRVRGNGHKLDKEKFMLDIKNNSSTERVVNIGTDYPGKWWN